MSLESKVKKALDEIRPILQQDGGDVEFVGIEGKTVMVRMQGACSSCPSAKYTLKEVIEDKIKEACPEIESVQDADDEPEPPPEPASSDPFEDRKPIPGVKSIIAVASGKGGVGKSTVAVNLALALKATGKTVGLLDADIYGPSIPSMLAIEDQPEMDGEKVNPIKKHGIYVMSMGFFLEADTPVIWRGPMIMKALDQLIRDVNWGVLDCLVVDLPPGTGDAQLTLVQSVPLNGAVIVTTPSDVALIDVRRAIGMFSQVGVPVSGVIENMSYFVCPHCQEQTDVFSRGGGKKIADDMKIGFLGEIPLDAAIGKGSDQGNPIVVADPKSAQARAFISIADKIASTL